MESSKAAHPECMKRLATIILILLLVPALRIHARNTVTNDAGLLDASPKVSDTDRVPAMVSGTLKDDRGVPIVNAYVECTANGHIVGRELTDFDGTYCISGIAEPCIDVAFKFQGKECVVLSVALLPGTVQTANGVIPSVGCFTNGCTFYRKVSLPPPLINLQHPGSSSTHSGNMLW